MWRNDSEPATFGDAGGRGAQAAVSGEGGTLGIADGIYIFGDVAGRHNLTIAGSLTGSVFVPENRVVVCRSGDVRANMTARVIEVEGSVAGDLKAAERVVIRKSSRVEGDIFSPQVQLEEGCQFKGSVQMSEPDVSRKPPTRNRVIGEHGTVNIEAANE